MADKVDLKFIEHTSLDNTWAGYIAYGYYDDDAGPRLQGRACFYCAEESPHLQRCARCGALYCDVTCQRRDWRERHHKAVCWTDDVYALLKPMQIVTDKSVGLPGSKLAPQSGQKFIVKVQADRERWHGPIEVYSASRAVFVMLYAGGPHYTDLQTYLRFAGEDDDVVLPASPYVARYFWAETTGEGDLKLYPNRPLCGLAGWC